MKTSLLILTLCAAAMAQTPAGTATKAPAPKAATPAAAPKAAAPKAAAPAGPNLLNPDTLKATAPAEYNVKFVTSKGEVLIHVTRAWAPNGADRFYNLVRGGFYDNAAFFRVLTGFMAQFGVSARPEVSRIWENRNIPDDRVMQSNTRGKVTFAQTGAPNSRSTQVFINYGSNNFLDGQRFAPFGEVVSGMEVMDNLYSGYGEGAPQGRGPDQGRLVAEGKAYLDKGFPMLDRILKATIEPVAPAAPAAGAAPPDTKK
jgi:peptidyl-prolyl cis-trans isomerase A (cyclophilin A)